MLHVVYTRACTSICGWSITNRVKRPMVRLTRYQKEDVVKLYTLFRVQLHVQLRYSGSTFYCIPSTENGEIHINCDNCFSLLVGHFVLWLTVVRWFILLIISVFPSVCLSLFDKNVNFGHTSIRSYNKCMLSIILTSQGILIWISY